MSYGTVCLRCRRYLPQACTCDNPIPSENGVTPSGEPMPGSSNAKGHVEPTPTVGPTGKARSRERRRKNRKREQERRRMTDR